MLITFVDQRPLDKVLLLKNRQRFASRLIFPWTCWGRLSGDKDAGSQVTGILHQDLLGPGPRGVLRRPGSQSGSQSPLTSALWHRDGAGQDVSWTGHGDTQTLAEKSGQLMRRGRAACPVPVCLCPLQKAKLWRRWDVHGHQRPRGACAAGLQGSGP